MLSEQKTQTNFLKRADIWSRYNTAVEVTNQRRKREYEVGVRRVVGKCLRVALAMLIQNAESNAEVGEYIIITLTDRVRKDGAA